MSEKRVRAVRVIVSRRGQVTIPKSLRERLGIRPGTELECSTNGGNLIARKAATDPVSSVFGCLRVGMSTDRFI